MKPKSGFCGQMLHHNDVNYKYMKCQMIKPTSDHRSILTNNIISLGKGPIMPCGHVKGYNKELIGLLSVIFFPSGDTST